MFFFTLFYICYDGICSILIEQTNKNTKKNYLLGSKRTHRTQKPICTVQARYTHRFIINGIAQ